MEEDSENGEATTARTTENSSNYSQPKEEVVLITYKDQLTNGYQHKKDEAQPLQNSTITNNPFNKQYNVPPQGETRLVGKANPTELLIPIINSKIITQQDL